MKPRYLGAAMSQMGPLCLRRVDGYAEAQKVSPAFMTILDPCTKLEDDHPSISAFRGVQRVCARGHFGGRIRATCIDQCDFNAVLTAEMPHPELTGAFKIYAMLNAVV